MPLGMVCQADLQFAVDHEPGGRQHRYDLATVRHPVGWLRFQQVDAYRRQVLADQAERRTPRPHPPRGLVAAVRQRPDHRRPGTGRLPPPTSTPQVPSSGSPKTSSTSATGCTRPSIQTTTTAISPAGRTAATPPHRPEQANGPFPRTALCEEVAEDREAYEQGLRLTWEHEDEFDPLLGEIAAARNAMLAAEPRMRLLIAYGREFTRPCPYRLEDLARAAGMSISGVRTSYDDDEITEVARLTGARPGPPPCGSPVTSGPGTLLRLRPRLAVRGSAHRGWRRRRGADGHAWWPGLPLPGVLLLLRGGLPRPVPGTARSPAPGTTAPACPGRGRRWPTGRCCLAN